jgi:Adaptin N terminal region
MQTEDIEQKELVYLINYAQTQPDLVIFAVNMFVRDPDDQNPFIRALAIRTIAYASKRSSHTSPVHYRRVYMTRTHLFGRLRPYALPSYMISSRSSRWRMAS